MNRLLEAMFKMERWENLINKADLKGIDKGELRQYCKPEVRAALYQWILKDDSMFPPSHMAQVPKDTPGEFRTVFVGETCERILCSLINDCLFELFPEMVHPTCKSYQKGIGTGKVVLEVVETLQAIKGNIVGCKGDYHHYFDVVKRESILHMFDVVEQKLGYEKNTEPVMNLLRRTWNCDLVFDLDGNLIEKYNGIRQGNPIGSWLADVILYETDEYMSKKYKFYCRYSDDFLVITDSPQEALEDMAQLVSPHGVNLHPTKTEILTNDKWFKFLGFHIKGNQITLSKGRVKDFQNEIASRTTGLRNVSLTKATNSVNRYLYKGDGTYSWATSVLPIINVQKDIDKLNEYVMDSLRACATGKKKIGGLGVVMDKEDYTILRGTGKNVKANRMKTPKEIPNYMSIRCMQNALLCNRAVYDTLVRSM